MKLLTKAQQDDISRQMSIKSRDIDVCFYEGLEGSLPKDMMFDCLMLYKNSDGGYGNGLNIDNYNPNSSPYQTYEAFRLLDLLDLGADSDHECFEEVVNKAMNYLYNRVAPTTGYWQANVKSNNDYAHSEMFDYNDETKAYFGMHPTAALLGYTLTLCKPTKAYYKKALKQIPILLKVFYGKEEFTKPELISFGSLLHSLKKANVLEEDQKKLEDKLTEYVKNHISLEFDDPNANRPLDVALYLDDPCFDEAKNKQLDYLIDSIAVHGLWDHLGGWGWDKYSEEDSAKLKWIGCGTAYNYFLLKKYGRLE